VQQPVPTDLVLPVRSTALQFALVDRVCCVAVTVLVYLPASVRQSLLVQVVRDVKMVSVALFASDTWVVLLLTRTSAKTVSVPGLSPTR
jgi:hypothetical protein